MMRDNTYTMLNFLADNEQSQNKMLPRQYGINVRNAENTVSHFCAHFVKLLLEDEFEI
jgi:hypothetical protein